VIAQPALEHPAVQARAWFLMVHARSRGQHLSPASVRQAGTEAGFNDMYHGRTHGGWSKNDLVNSRCRRWHCVVEEAGKSRVRRV
jgi:hypothetical protein